MKMFKKLGMRSLATAIVLVAATPAAFADKKSEAYVQANANSVLQVLNDKSLSQAAREAKFGEYMNKFAHMPTIARRVLGVNARSVSEPGRNSVAPESMIVTRRSICRTMTSMCLSWIDTPCAR